METKINSNSELSYKDVSFNKSFGGYKINVSLTENNKKKHFLPNIKVRNLMGTNQINCNYLGNNNNTCIMLKYQKLKN